MSLAAGPFFLTIAGRILFLSCATHSYARIPCCKGSLPPLLDVLQQEGACIRQRLRKRLEAVRWCGRRCRCSRSKRPWRRIHRHRGLQLVFSEIPTNQACQIKHDKSSRTGTCPTLCILDSRRVFITRCLSLLGGKTHLRAILLAPLWNRGAALDG